MTEIRELVLASLTMILVVAFAFALYGVLVPPYTDAQIQESFVDTWEVSAFITFTGLTVVSMAGILAALLSWRTTGLAKRLAIASVVLSILSFTAFIYAHAVLTERTTQLTGQTFGGTFGWGLL